MQAVLEFIDELQLKKKLNPVSNPQITWFYLFFPSLLGYFMLMASHLNQKPIIGSLDVIHAPQFHRIIPKSFSMELIVTDVIQSEGPLWIEDSSGLGHLLFSDTKDNRILKWEEGKGVFTVGKTVYLENSGCFKGNTECSDGERIEPGSNGLLRQSIPELLNAPEDIDLIVCQHGDRALSLLMSNGTRVWLARSYKGERLNSPNDVIKSPEGHLYFTDPIYGLYTNKTGNKEIDEDARELAFSGVYMIPVIEVARSIATGKPTQRLVLLDDTLTKPNGLAFSPDYSKFYVSNSDPENNVIMVYDVSDDGKGSVSNPRVFYNATAAIEDGKLNGSGNLDGMVVDIHGNLFVTGPGGVLVISPKGTLLGRMLLGGRKTTNVAFGESGMLYITGDEMVVRTKVLTRPIR